MYLREFRVNWRNFVSACLGMGLGASFSHYTMSLFGPPLLAEFGWSKADFALVGTLSLINLFLMPFGGRFVDRFGTRLSSIIGFSSLSLGFLAFALMSGDIVEFFVIWVLQHVFGMLTATIVFCRMIVEKFDRSRGLALSLVMTASPTLSVFAVPLLGSLIEVHGWRAGYFAMAAITAVGGATAIALMERRERPSTAENEQLRLSPGEFGRMLRHPVLILALAAMFLVNMPQSFANTQLKLVLMDQGLASQTATWLMSVYAGGVVVGRILSGAALDRIAVHIVALTVLVLPAFGYLLLAINVTTVLLVAVAIGLMGFAQGAEADIGAYLISRSFDTKNFSLLMSLMSVMSALGSSAGSLAMSTALRLNDSYVPFLWLAAGGTVLGALLLALTGRRQTALA